MSVYDRYDITESFVDTIVEEYVTFNEDYLIDRYCNEKYLEPYYGFGSYDELIDHVIYRFTDEIEAGAFDNLIIKKLKEYE